MGPPWGIDPMTHRIKCVCSYHGATSRSGIQRKLEPWWWLPFGRKERNILFNDALNTFYLRLYGVGHMVKNHSDSEIGNLLPPHGLLIRLAEWVLLYAPSHRQDSTYHSLCYTSREALAGTRNTSMGSIHERSIRRPIAPWANALTKELYLAPVYR